MYNNGNVLQVFYWFRLKIPGDGKLNVYNCSKVCESIDTNQELCNTKMAQCEYSKDEFWNLDLNSNIKLKTYDVRIISICYVYSVDDKYISITSV